MIIFTVTSKIDDELLVRSFTERDKAVGYFMSLLEDNPILGLSGEAIGALDTFKSIDFTDHDNDDDAISEAVMTTTDIESGFVILSVSSVDANLDDEDLEDDDNDDDDEDSDNTE